MMSFRKRTIRILVNLPYHVIPFSSDCKKDSDPLKQAIQTEVVKERERLAKFRKEHGNAKVGDITVAQLYGGMRGMLGFVCDTSNLNANTGIQFRGLSIPQIQMCLPKAANGCEPLPEGMWWLLCTGEVPTEENVAFISKQWAKLGKLPDYAVKILKSLPKNLHPMTQFSIGVECLNCNSKFNKAYNENKPRQDRWMYVLEDATDMLAKIPSLAAHIYNNTFRDGKGCYELDPKLDWSANFCNMLGFDNPGFKELMRLYLTIHSDHEGGNVSAHACHLVGSALSDPYLSFAAGMNGLAGPLHGLANQEVLLWLDAMIKDIGKTPSEEEMKKWIQNFMKTPGKVVPGYGHAVLLVTDPRYDCQADFAKRVIPDDPLVQLVAKVYKVVPPLLKSLGKVRNPWPNVDAHSGVLLRHYGMTQASYYTVLFGVSRAMGLMAQLIWARALLLPIERPDTITTDALMEMAMKTKCEKK